MRPFSSTLYTQSSHSLCHLYGCRVCPYLDPTEEKHGQIKRFLFSLVASRHGEVIPLLRSYLKEIFEKVEDEVGAKGKSKFNSISDSELFKFVFRYYCGEDPTRTNLGSCGSTWVNIWVYPQLLPVGSAG